MSSDPIFCFPCLRNVAEDPKRASSTRIFKKQTAGLALRSNVAGIAPQPDGQANCSDPSSFRCRSCSTLGERFRQRASNPRFARLSPPYPPRRSEKIARSQMPVSGRTRDWLKNRACSGIGNVATHVKQCFARQRPTSYTANSRLSHSAFYRPVKPLRQTGRFYVRGRFCSSPLTASNGLGILSPRARYG